MAVCRGFSSAQKQPKQNARGQNREENGSTTLRNTREKPLLAGYHEMKHLEIRQKYDSAVRSFNFLLSVLSGDETKIWIRPHVFPEIIIQN